MQNRYVGDVGDFGKYGLLRWLTGITGPYMDQKLRLGVLWYFNRGEGPGGQQEPYLEDPTYEQYDRRLHTVLRRIVEGPRNIVCVENSGILPINTLYQNEEVPNNAGREAWLRKSEDKIDQANLVFIDPDIGIASENQEADHSRAHAFMYELWPFIERGQSLVIYQHAAHASREMLIMYLTLRLQRELGLTWVRTLRFHLRDRFFFIVVQPKHKEIINNRLASFRESLWCTAPARLFTLYDEPWPSISLPCSL